MIFDIGCCCTIPSGGIYDFWAIGGDTFSFSDYGREKSTIVSRMPSRQSFIYNYIGANNFTTARQRLEDNFGVYDNVHITSFLIGDYMDLWRSGEMLEDSFSNYQHVYNQPKSMNLVGQERLWISSLINSSGQTYDYFNHSGISYDVNRTIGSGAEITGNYLRCITGDVSSGVYVKWAFPDNFMPLRSASVTMENNFDKVILFTLNHPSGSPYGTKTEIWFSPSIPRNSNTYIKYTGDTIVSNDRISFIGFNYSLYNDDNISSNELLHINIFDGVEGHYLKDLEIRLVDSVSGYTLDDVSGYSCLLYDLRIPYMISGGVGVNSSRPDYLDKGDIRLSLVDPVSKSILYNRTMKYANSYWRDLTGIDYYKYGSYNILTIGEPYENSSLWGDVGTFNEKPMLSPYIFNTYESALFSGHTGSIIVQRQLRNSAFSDTSTDNVVAFTPNGSGILVSNIRELFTDDTPTYPVPSVALEHGVTNNYDIFNYYGINNSVETYANTPGILSNLSAMVFDYVQRYFIGLNTDCWPEIVAMIDTSGNETLLHGTTHHFTTAEYNIPADEKIAYYQKFLRRYHTTGYSGDWYPLDINNFNTGPTLPKIGYLSARDAPKAFCVDLPRMHFITGTGEYLTARGPSGMLNQTTKILYGDIKQSTFTTSMLSGQWLGGGITGGASDGGGGSTINYLINFDFTGYNGDARPYTTFSYSGFSDESRTGLMLKTGRIYDFEFDLLHGDASGEIFWEDSLEQNVRYYKYHYDFGINEQEYPEDPNFWYSGLYRSPATPNISVNVLYGSKHLATNTLGASFIHSYNHYILGNLQDSISGEAYVKLKIGDNIVYNQRLYAKLDDWGLNYLYRYPVIGPFALHATNDEQKTLMSGNYAAFVWFEQLYKTNPVPVIGTTFDKRQSGYGTPTGWKMHVTNQTGGDIFSISISGLDEDMVNYSYMPYIQDSSDEFFYVNDFLIPYTGVANGEYATTTQSFLDETGGTRNPRYVFGYALWNISGAVKSFGMSHDCKAFIPGGNEFDEIIFAGSSGITVPGEPYTEWRANYSLVNTCVKNTSLMASTPKRSDWLVGSGFPYDTKYYTITGVWMYETPTGQAPIFPLSNIFGRYKHTLFSTTGFDLSLYPGYQSVTSGLPYLRVLPESSNVGPFLYVKSGTTQSGWL